jgi:hypothetical protein
MTNVMVYRRSDLYNVVILNMKRESAADTTIGTNGVGLGLLGFIPCPSLS